jgi:hypothetical protein
MANSKLSRRQFLGGTAAVAAASVLPAVTSAAPALATPEGTFPDASVKAGLAATPLDPEALARQGYEIYKGFHAGQSACCEATYWPVLGALAERFPDSMYSKIPKGLFNFGGGGVNAWRSICGSPNGGAAMLKIVTGNGNVIDEYLTWYERTAFPSNDTYTSFAKGDWTIPDPAKYPKNKAPMAVPKGILCHASLGRWTEAAGGLNGAWVKTQFAGNLDLAASDRCGKLVFDCVYKLTQLVNDWAADVIPTPTLDPAVGTCLTSGCHGGAGGYDPLVIECAPSVKGKMKCDEACHQ